MVCSRRTEAARIDRIASGSTIKSALVLSRASALSLVGIDIALSEARTATSTLGNSNTLPA